MRDLSALRQAAGAAEPLRRRLEISDGLVRDAEAALAVLLQDCEKEQRDVERLKGGSFSGFLLKATGRYETRLRKEEREELDAKRRYDQAVATLTELRAEQSELRGKLSDANAQARAYQAALKEEREALQAEGDEAWLGFNREREACLSQQVELSEALREAERADGTARQIQASLTSARDWATYDIWGGGGLLTHAMKYDHVDTAARLFRTLSAQLSRLNAELRDVCLPSAPSLREISPGERAMDFWLDNIFTDLNVRDQIVQNLEQVETLLRQLDTLCGALRRQEEALCAELGHIERRAEEYLVNRRNPGPAEGGG